MKPSLVLTKSRTVSVLAAALAISLPAFASDDKKPRPPRPAPNDEPSPANRAEPRTEMRTWLGVATSPVAPVLREHLELADGFGIQVEYVVEGSPAEKAGLTERDILTKLDEQLLTSPEHLAVLVRSMKKGDRITLTLIRKGAEQTVDVTLGENEVPVQPEWPRQYGFQLAPSPENPRQWQFRGEFPLPEGLDNREWQESVRDYQDRLKDWMERSHPQQLRPRDERPDRDAGQPPRPPRPALPLPGKDEARNDRPSQPGKEDQPDAVPGDGAGKPPALSVRPGFPIEVFSGAGLIRIDNEQGEVSIQVKDGEHSIKIVNADGETVYEGAYDPEKGAEGLPEEARKQLKKMKLDDLELLGVPHGGSGTRSETKTEIKIQIGGSEETSTDESETKGGLL